MAQSSRPTNGFPKLKLYRDYAEDPDASIHIYEEAQQIWLILVAVAMAPRFSSKTPPRITYGELSKLLMKPKAGRTLSRQLNVIWKLCHFNGIPELNSIVVGGDDEEPGDGIPGNEVDRIFEQQKAVMRKNWFNIRIPSLKEFQTAAQKYTYKKRPDGTYKLEFKGDK